MRPSLLCFVHVAGIYGTYCHILFDRRTLWHTLTKATLKVNRCNLCCTQLCKLGYELRACFTCTGSFLTWYTYVKKIDDR